MSLGTNRVTTSKLDIFEALLDSESDELLVVVTDTDTIEALLEALSDCDDAPTVRLLAASSVLKTVRGDFVLASTAADLVEDGTLSLRTTDEQSGNAMALSDDVLVSLVPAGRYTAGLSTDDAEFVAEANEFWRTVWDESEAFALRTPARSRIADSLQTTFGPEIESEFEAMTDVLRTARGSESGGLDEIGASLLVAAKHEELLYDISKWGEEVGVASKATFSRTKTALEQQGLITTEKVPIDVGRPRLRLLLADDRFEDASAEEIASCAHGVLSRTRA